MSSLEFKLATVERRVSGVCFYGKVVRDVRQSLYGGGYTVEYVYC